MPVVNFMKILRFLTTECVDDLWPIAGINLRKVEVKQEKERTAMPNSVEAILARRIAVELSDSEEDGSYSGSEDNEDWSD